MGTELIDDCGVGQGCDIAEGIVLVGGDLTQNSPHDLAGAGLGQTRRPLQQVGSGNRADFLPHPGDELAPLQIPTKSPADSEMMSLGDTR